MSDYRRWRVPGATFFFEACLEDPSATLLHDKIAALSDAWAETARALPFLTEVLVIEPARIRTIWTLPAGDSDFPERWRQIKYRFSRLVPDRVPRRASLIRKRERGLWQRRYYEHVVRNEVELAGHLAAFRHELESASVPALATFEPFDSAEGFPLLERAEALMAA